MLFNSLTFLAFFCIVYALHRLLPSWTLQKRLLLVASYIFYAAWHPPYVLILFFSTTLDWWLARRMAQSADGVRRKRLLLISLIANLGLLGYFKYGGFLLDTLSQFLTAAGVSYQPPQWDIVLPVGISFYTFASLSYTIDVYRGRIPGTATLADYALFVSFFPHLVAGPIVRAGLLLPQIETPRRARADQVGWGLVLLCLGLFCKSVLADALFAPVVDAVYAQPAAYGALEAWAALLGFSGQIYYDFAGYSLAAIGLALCFGFEFPDNFRLPYGARSFSDFWRRWHISLSTWLRDYLYIPLGGNRGTEWQVRRTLMLTMLIGGLWHGASWMFVLWGGLHGLYLTAERRYSRPHTAEQGPVLVRTLVTFLVVTLTWLPFRAPDPGILAAMVAASIRFDDTNTVPPAQLAACYLGMALTVAGHVLWRDTTLEAQFSRLAPLAQSALLALCLIALFLFTGGNQRAFIYFQF